MRLWNHICGVTLGCVFSIVMASGGAQAGGDGHVAFRVGAVEFLGTGPSYVDVGVGVFDVFLEDDDITTPAARIELRWGEKLFFIGPAIGIMANTDGGVFGYGGIYADIRYGNFILMPLLAVGGYHQGDSKDLGGVFQFRVGLGFNYQTDGGERIGIRLDHVSNAGTHSSNPGEEELLFTLSIPLGRIFGSSGH